MLKITGDMIKRLRATTGNTVSIPDCIKILTETVGDVNKSVQLLAERGILPFTKKENIIDSLEWRTPYKLGELITIIANDYDKNRYSPPEKYFCLYAKRVEGFYLAELTCYLDDYPDGSGNEDVYPDFIVKEGLEYFYDGQQFEDVIFNALHQKRRPSMIEFISALEYYSKRDSFMDLQ
jgi:hypothetical protein